MKQPRALYLHARAEKGLLCRFLAGWCSSTQIYIRACPLLHADAASGKESEDVTTNCIPANPRIFCWRLGINNSVTFATMAGVATNVCCLFFRGQRGNSKKHVKVRVIVGRMHTWRS